MLEQWVPYHGSAAWLGIDCLQAHVLDAQLHLAMPFALNTIAAVSNGSTAQALPHIVTDKHS